MSTDEHRVVLDRSVSKHRRQLYSNYHESTVNKCMYVVRNAQVITLTEIVITTYTLH
jgi:hypothetical protein